MRATLYLKRQPFGCIHLGEIDSTNRAASCAGTAFDALIGIDLVLAVALGDGANRAVAGTSAAHNARITNFISHNYSSFGVFKSDQLLVPTYSINNRSRLQVYFLNFL